MSSNFKIALPKELDYKSSLPSLPSGSTSIENYLAPVNGSSFSTSVGGTQIQFDLPARSFFVPSSLYLRYSYAITNTAGYTSNMLGCPAYSPIQSLTTFCNSSVLESINNYGQVMAMQGNLSYNVADKLGLQSSLGYGSASGGSDISALDGRACTTNETGSMAMPLFGILNQSENYLPLSMMGVVRVQLGLDRLSNFFQSNNLLSTNEVPLSFTMTNVELCYTSVDFGSSVDDMIKGNGEPFYIKSQSVTSSSNTISLTSTGYQEVVFSTRLASVKSVFLTMPTSGSTSSHGIFESFDVTKGGTYQVSINGRYLPNKPIDVGQQKTSALMELKKAVSALNNINQFSINSLEFNRVCGVATTLNEPAKFYIGLNTEILPSSTSTLLTGVSTQSSPITVRLNVVTATSGITTPLTLICLYDALFEINPSLKTCVVKQ